MTLKRSCLHHDPDGGSADAVSFHAGSYFFGETPEDRGQRLCVILEGDILRCGRLIGVALRVFLLRMQNGRADPVCRAVNIRAAFFSQDRLEDPDVRPRRVPDGADPERVQARRRGCPASEQFSDRQRPQLLRDLRRPERMRPVGFFEIARHLREELVLRDTDIDRKLKLFPDLLPQCRRFRQRVRDARHIRESFIDGHLFHQGGMLFQDPDECLGILSVGLKIRRDQDQVRTFSQRRHDRLPGGDPEFFCRNGFRRDHSVPRLHIPSHSRRHRPEIQGGGIVLQPLYGGPGKKSRIHIHMKYDLHPSLLSPQV